VDDLSDLLGPEDAPEDAPLPLAPAPVPTARRAARDFLRLLSEGYSVTKAAAACGVPRTAFYHLRDLWPEFAEAWRTANEAAVDLMEDAAIKRAVFGVERKVYYQGEEIGSYREYSDGLLVTLLKAKAPERYRERYDINQHLDVTINHADEILAARKRAGLTIDATATTVAHTSGSAPDQHGGRRCSGVEKTTPGLA
jgi:hypothetical protein